jgi:hypothetical protein
MVTRRGAERISVAMSVAFVLFMSAGCGERSPTPEAELLEVEANAETVVLPTTRLVTCHRADDGDVLFHWEGSDVFLARRPLGDEHTSTLDLRFTADPPIAVALVLHLEWPGHTVDLRWFRTSGSAPLALDSDRAGRRYVLIGTDVPAGASTRRLDIRVTFTC